MHNWEDDFARADGGPGADWNILRGDWTISDHRLISPSGPGERLAVRAGFALGRRFTVSATIRGLRDDYWYGVAVNVSENGDGTQNFYVLRVVTRDGSRPPHWQLLQMSESHVADDGLLASGPVPVVKDHDYTITVGSKSLGVLHVSIEEEGTSLLDNDLVVPLDTLLSGGQAGVYTNAGHISVDRARGTTSVPESSAPDPGPLQYIPFEGSDYTLPDTHDSVVESSVVGLNWSGHPVRQALLTSGTDQYVGYYDPDRRMTVAHRQLGADEWTTQSLDSVLGWDSHNYVTMAVDSAGHLHVSGNMHGDPLVYFRTTRPADVTSLTRVTTMVDAATELKVTYPEFFQNASGDLVFRYRDGGSGNGVDLYNVYDPATTQWSRLLDTPLHDGEGRRNAYVERPVLGPDGNFHIAWVWRDTPDAATNALLSYAKSPDLENWYRADGTPISLPMTYGAGDIVDPIPMNGGILNGNSDIGFDGRGRALIAYNKYDHEGNTQVYIARYENRGWVSHQISQWKGRWLVAGYGTLITQVITTAPEPLPDGNIRFDFICKGNKRTFILSPALRPIAEVDTPQLPAEITEVRSDFAGMHTRRRWDDGESEDGRYLLRWESRGSNGDQPWPPPHPEPSTLEVYLMR
ncbi:BNR repeat-containing protein [Haloactinopolyspora alba]|uniref:BNR repeat-containing protein n=1 Tax=Haloactinopolyspora alba TaxID=648780 RepID=UPI0013EB6274|nr:BNR repeat-containing protein [Haloactinopolyspora alba]